MHTGAAVPVLATVKNPLARYRTRSTTRAAILWLGCVVTVPAIPRCLAAQIEVGATGHVSAMMPQAAHTEAFIVAHPADANRLAVCTMVVDPTRNRMSAALYLSDDRGTTWRLAVHDTVSRVGESWDPTCAFAPDSVVLFATLPVQGDPTGPALDDVTRVYRSQDNGRTWAKPLDAPWLDNEDLTVDWTSGPNRGRIYVVGVRLKSAVPGRRYLSLLYSTDGGRNFDAPVDRFPDPGTRQGTVGAPIVAGDGSLLVPVILMRERSSQSSPGTAPTLEPAVAIVRVTNGGTAFDAPATVAAVKGCASDAGPPVAAVDRTSGPFSNRAYVVFADATQGRCQIKLSWSDDGKIWSSPIPVDDPPIPLDPETGPDAFFPQVAVNANGIVGVTWYDRREDARNRDFRQRFTASADGGSSVLRSVAVSQYPYHYSSTNEREALFPLATRFVDSTGAIWIAAATGSAQRIYYQVGDYGGLAVRADGAFQPIWVDNRHGVPQLFTTPIDVTVRAMQPEVRDRERGHDVSKSVFITTTRTSFDAATCTLDFGLELTNMSERALTLPLTVRVEHMLSQLGVPLARESASDDLGRPLWIVGRTGQLLPRERITHRARFGLESCRPLSGRGQYTYRYPIDARLQGTPPAGLAGPKILAVKLRVFEKP